MMKGRRKMSWWKTGCAVVGGEIRAVEEESVVVME